MKLTNLMLINSVPALNKINTLDLPIKVSFLISKNLKEIQKELDVYNVEKQKLIQKYGEKDENGNLKIKENGSIDIVDIENWNKDIVELNSIELNINIELIDINSLSDNICLTPSEINLVDFMFE